MASEPWDKMMMTSETIPADVLFFHILPRLPGKSILRFRCVSTQWHSFLKTPTFAQINLHHAHKKLLLFSTTPTQTQTLGFRTMDCETPENGFNNTRPLPFKTTSNDLVYVLSSLNWLLSVGIIPWKCCYTFSHLILWNPLMGEFKILPRNEECYNYSYHGHTFDLHYSSSDNGYNLMHVSRAHDVYIYSLKSDSWRKVKLPIKSRITISSCFYCDPKPCLNEKLYFIKVVYKIPDAYYSIIRFDLKTNKLIEIAAPTSPLDGTMSTVNLCILRGCIHFCVSQVTEKRCDDYVLKFEMWRMDTSDREKIRVY